MKHVLARRNLRSLAHIASLRVLLGFDFDGTLAPIVSVREGACMREATLALFAKVCVLYPCAVVSGRSVADVTSRLDGAPVKYVVGNHGLEPGLSLPRFARDVARAKKELEHSLANLANVDIEDKRYSLAVHYRGARAKTATRKAIEQAVASLKAPMRMVPGKYVVNVIPRRAPDKGMALLALRATERAEAVVYVGDDVTDEDVFRFAEPETLMTIRVGAARSSAAQFFLRNQREMDRFLLHLTRFRPAPMAR